MAAIYEIAQSLNVLAGTTGLDAQYAANKWAGTTGKDLLAALNAKNGTTALDFNAVCNALNSTTGSGREGQDALSMLAGGGHS